MKATDFAGFYDFGIEKVKWEDISEEDKDENWLDEEDEYYAVYDEQGCFHTRYITDVKDLVTCFDSMDDDYLFDDAKECGFEYDDNDEDEEVIQLIKWCEINEPDSTRLHVLKVYNCLEEIENDVA